MLKKSRLWRDVMVLASGRDLQWQEFVANNATAAILSGGAVTAATGTNCPAYWFSGPSTLILGRNPRPGSDPTTATIARWDIAVDQGAIASMQRAFVVIDCIRNFGGLHTRRKDAWAWIWLNAQCVDAFTLCVRPVGHSDYFHRPPVPEFPRCLAFADYQTIYAWLIPRHALANQANQELQVKIDPEVRWDIGHVSIVIANVNGQSSTTFFKAAAYRVGFTAVPPVFGLCRGEPLARLSRHAPLRMALRWKPPGLPHCCAGPETGLAAPRFPCDSRDVGAGWFACRPVLIARFFDSVRRKIHLEE